MKTTQNTILITGGSAGIGLEMAKQFDALGNHVIITGRDDQRLLKATLDLPNVTAINCDVTSQKDVERLVKTLATEFPSLNLVINNAGRAYVHDLKEDDNGFEMASEEILTNYLSVIRLNELVLPLLSRQKEAAIVHVTSIVAFVPNHRTATYGASKAALHSYSLSLRLALEKSPVKVFELMPPLVNTAFSQEIGGANGIPPADVAKELINAIEQNKFEIHVGKTAYIYELSRSSPADALLAMNPSLN